MGVVWKAHQLSAKRTVALKVIRPDRLAGLPADKRRKAIDRFVIEAQAAAQLQHDHVVPVYDVGENDGRPYYSIRYVEGFSLEALVEKGPLDPPPAAAPI